MDKLHESTGAIDGNQTLLNELEPEEQREHEEAAQVLRKLLIYLFGDLKNTRLRSIALRVIVANAIILQDNNKFVTLSKRFKISKQLLTSYAAKFCKEFGLPLQRRSPTGRRKMAMAMRKSWQARKAKRCRSHSGTV